LSENSWARAFVLFSCRFARARGTNLFINVAGSEMEDKKSIASALSPEHGEVSIIALRRVPTVICAVVAIDWLLLGSLFYWFDWRIPLTGTILTSAVGLLVIVYYEWRWSEAVAKRLELEPGFLDRWSFEKILLLIDGFIFLIPGVATDFLAVLILMPGIRRTIVNLCRLCL
jgi:UPF0716 family protein affecting phage T7 exclusion